MTSEAALLDADDVVVGVILVDYADKPLLAALLSDFPNAAKTIKVTAGTSPAAPGYAWDGNDFIAPPPPPEPVV